MLAVSSPVLHDDVTGLALRGHTFVMRPSGHVSVCRGTTP